MGRLTKKLIRDGGIAISTYVWMGEIYANYWEIFITKLMCDR